MAYFAVIIPIYNAAPSLGKAITSLISQSFRDFEVICVDDSSEDNSVEIINSYICKDKRIKLLALSSNVGPLAARAAGIRNAASEYVLFLDSDDWLESEFLKRVHKRLVKKPTDILQFGYIEEPTKKKVLPKNLTNKDERIIRLLGYSKRSSPQIWTKVYRNTVINAAFSSMDIFNAKFAEDLYISVATTLISNTFDSINIHPYHYFVGQGITNNKETNKDKITSILKSYSGVAKAVKTLILNKAPRLEQYCTTMEIYFLHDIFHNRVSQFLTMRDFSWLIHEVICYFTPETFSRYVSLKSQQAYWSEMTFANRIPLRKRIKRVLAQSINWDSQTERYISKLDNINERSK